MRTFIRQEGDDDDVEDIPDAAIAEPIEGEGAEVETEPEVTYQFVDEDGNPVDDEPEEGEEGAEAITEETPAEETPEEVAFPAAPEITPPAPPTVWNGWRVAPDGFTLSEEVFENPDGEQARLLRTVELDEEGKPIMLLTEGGKPMSPWGEEEFSRRLSEYRVQKSRFEDARVAELNHEFNSAMPKITAYETDVIKHMIKDQLGDFPEEIAVKVFVPLQKQATVLLSQQREQNIKDMVDSGIPRHHAEARVNHYFAHHPELVAQFLALSVLPTPENPQAFNRFIKSVISAAKETVTAQANRGRNQNVPNGTPPAARPAGQKPPVRVPGKPAQAPAERPAASTRPEPVQRVAGAPAPAAAAAPERARVIRPNAEEVQMARLIGLPDDHFAGKTRGLR